MIFKVKHRFLHISGPVFGNRDAFTGLAIFLDTYSNHNGPHNVSKSTYIQFARYIIPVKCFFPKWFFLSEGLFERRDLSSQVHFQKMIRSFYFFIFYFFLFKKKMIDSFFFGLFLNLKGFLKEGTCIMWILLRVHSLPWQSFSLLCLFLFFTFNSVCEPFFLWWSNLSQAHVLFLWLSNIFFDFWFLSLGLVLLLAISCSSFFSAATPVRVSYDQ